MPRPERELEASAERAVAQIARRMRDFRKEAFGVSSGVSRSRSAGRALGLERGIAICESAHPLGRIREVVAAN